MERVDVNPLAASCERARKTAEQEIVHKARAQASLAKETLTTAQAIHREGLKEIRAALELAILDAVDEAAAREEAFDRGREQDFENETMIPACREQERSRNTLSASRKELSERVGTANKVRFGFEKPDKRLGKSRAALRRFEAETDQACEAASAEARKTRDVHDRLWRLLEEQ